MIARVVHAAAWATGISVRRALAQRAQRVLMLHGVGARGLALSALEGVLRAVGRRFEFVALDELVRRLATTGASTGREVAVTFDDGLRNHAALAAPLLARLRVPATFFICPDAIDSGAWLWTHEVRARLSRLSAGAMAAFAADSGVHGRSAADVLAWMKGLRREERFAAEAALRKETPDFSPTPEEREAYAPMTWSDVEGLDTTWVSIGSHTLSHPILPTLSPADAVREIAESRRVLEQRLGRSVPHFCYPNGSENPAVRALVARHYDAAVSTEPGIVLPSADLHSLPRIGVVASVPEVLWRFHRP